MSDGLNPTEMRAWRGLLSAHSRLIRVLDAELTAATGLTLNQYEVLLFLHAAPERALRMSQLAERVLLSKSGMTRAVDQLVARGLVERRRCPTDARGLLAVLTEAGQAKLRQAAPVHLAGIRRHFTANLEEGELRVLGGLLERVRTEEPEPAACPEAV